MHRLGVLGMSTLYSQKAAAMGTEVELQISCSSNKEAADVFNELWQKIAMFEARFSRFLPDSELTYVNKNAGKKTKITPQFRRWLSTLVFLGNLSDDLFNPFCLPDIQKNGYTASIKDNFKSGSKDLNYCNRITSDMSDMKIGEDWLLIPLNSALDSGGNGKGYIADQLSKFLGDNYTKFALSMGGDIICKSSSSPWHIPISNGHDKTDIRHHFTSNDIEYGIATSTPVRRSLLSEVRHIIDPRNGRTVKNNVKAVTIVAQNAVVADVLASCTIIGGKDYLIKLLSDNAIKAGLIQFDDGRIFSVGRGFSEESSAVNARKDLQYA